MGMDDIALGELIHNRIFGSDEQRQKEQERLRNDASEAQTLRKFLSLQDTKRKDEFTQMGLPDLRGELMAFTDGQRQAKDAALLREKQRQETAAAALQRVLQQSGETQSTVDSPVAPRGFGPFRRDLRVTSTGAPTMQGLTRALAQNPEAASAEHFAPSIQALHALLSDQNEAGGTVNFTEDPETGNRFATLRHQMMPSGVNPRRAGSAVPITGPNGESLGMGLPGRSGITPLRTGNVKDQDRYKRLSTQLNSLIASQGKAAYNQTAVTAYQKQIDDVISQLAELEQEGGGTAPASAPAAAGTNAPVRYKLVNGQLQLTQ